MNRPLGPPVDATPAPWPSRVTLEGQTVILEPLEESHADALFPHIGGAANAWLWDYMFTDVPSSLAEIRSRIARQAQSKDPFFWAIKVKKHAAQGTAEAEVVGYIAFLAIVPAHRSIEIGHVMYSAALQRTTAATEAIYLLGHYAIRDLGYRRLEWKCNDLNAASRKAAARYGFTFEGVFRQHYISKGRNRDTAWFSILDSEWERGVEAAFEQWLDPGNFDEEGKQKRRLESFR
ncbi:putative acetyltransferase, GNAT family [Talaromyces proteolyticus]|uniref:Acetyltransferase, GNAT family n=1 Tax=Talaromyces proteolyticus TaxID=1131652 RepID=A0AAD4KSW7_9EURO|nr:putative acetyltransferase, GNAT family [Talaromyces proteolyticus]KAH8698626.1 putative acetyltransferase, GNAT family [Talaromyces proteolyticus]